MRLPVWQYMKRVWKGKRDSSRLTWELAWLADEDADLTSG